MADLKLIGAVAVKVRPDAKGFKEDTRRQVLKELAGQDFEVEVDLTLDTNGVKEKAQRAIRDLKREAEQSIGLKVGVDPDSLRKASADLGKVLKDFKVTNLKVDMDRDYLAKAGRQLNAALNAAAAAGISVDVSTNEGIEQAKKDIDDFLDGEDGRKVKFNTFLAGLETAAAQLKYATRDRRVNFFVDVNKKSLVVAEGLLSSLAGLGVLTTVGQRLESLILDFDKFSLKSAAWATAIGSLTAALGFIGTSAFTVGEGMVQSIGLLATLPTALAATAAAVTINVAAFKNFKAAIDGDAEALAALPPQARAAAEALRGTWESIQRPVQAAFWEGMGESVQRFTAHTVPALREGLTRVSDDVGRFNAGILDAFDEVAKNGDLAKMFGNLEGFFQQASNASKPFFDALNTLGLRGSDYLPRFGGWLTDIAKGFDDWVTKADQAGKINVWIEKGVESLKDMGGAGAAIVGMFQGITRAVNDAGGGGLPVFRKNMESIADTMKGEPFRSRMATIFAGARKGASELNLGVKDLGDTLGRSAGYVSELLAGLGKMGGGFLTGLSRSLGQLQFQTGTLEGIKDMQAALADLGPSFEGLGRIVGNMSRVSGEIFKGVAPAINTVVGFLDKSVGKLAGNLEKVAAPLTGLVNALVTAAAGPLTMVVDMLNSTLTVFNGLPDPIKLATAAFGTFLALRGPLGGFLGTATGMWSKIADAARTGSKSTETATKRIGDMIYSADGTVRRFDAKPMVKQLDTISAKAAAVGKSVGGSLLALAGGPWGLALAGAGTAIALMGDAAAKQKSKLDDLRNALDGQTGINAATEKVIAAQLRAKESFLFWEQASIADSAGNIGISMRDLQKAAEGVPESVDKVNEALKRASSERNPFEKVVDSLTLLQKSGALSGAAGGMSVILDKMFGTDFAKTTAGLNKVRDDLEAVKVETAATAKQLGIPVGASAGIISAIDTLVSKASTADQKLRAVNDIIRQMDGGKSDTGDAVQRSNDAAREFGQNMDAIIEKAKGEGHALPDLFNMTTGEIDSVSGAGSKLRTELKGVADAGRDSALKLALAQKDPQAAIDTLRTEMQKTRDLIARPLELAGIPPYEVDKILDQLDLDPAKIEMLLNPESRDKALADLKLADDAAKGIVAAPAVKGLEVNSSKFDQGLQNATQGLDTFDGKRPTPELNANKNPFDRTIAQATADGAALGIKIFSPNVDANKTPFDNVVSTVKGVGATLDSTNYSPTVNVIGNALDVLGSITQKLTGLNGSVFTATIDVLAKAMSADGSINDGRNWDRRFMPKFYANGGIESHVAQIAKPSSTLRVWAEPETGGEAYIPLASSKRARSTAILDEVASKFGYDLVRKAELYANGGIVGGAQAGAGGDTHYHVDAKPGLAYEYARQIAHETATKTRDMQALYGVG